MLPELSTGLSDKYLLRGIDQYGDTYFNHIQVRILFDEVRELLGLYPEYSAMLASICGAAREILDAPPRRGSAAYGYLRFMGD